MRSGGGHAKGAEYERQVCASMSLWLTDGQRSDIFTRNVQSGGRFTSALKAGKDERGMPGDLMAAHPTAFIFMSLFLVECKHLASLGLEEFIYDGKGKSALAKIIALAESQAALAKNGLRHMIVAKQNRRESAVFVSQRVFVAMSAHTRLGIKLRHHNFHRGTTTMLFFEDMLTLVIPDRFLKAVAT